MAPAIPPAMPGAGGLKFESFRINPPLTVALSLIASIFGWPEEYGYPEFGADDRAIVGAADLNCTSSLRYESEERPTKTVDSVIMNSSTPTAPTATSVFQRRRLTITVSTNSTRKKIASGINVRGSCDGSGQTISPIDTSQPGWSTPDVGRN